VLRLVPLATLVLALFLAGALAVLPAENTTPASTASPTADSSATPSPSPSSSPKPATPTPEPTPEITATPAPTTPPPGTLHIGVWVRVTGSETCLNVRSQPGLVQRVPDGSGATLEYPVPVLNCLPDGFVGKLVDAGGIGPEGQEQHPPITADGHVWWYVLGQGWVAQDWLTPVSDEAPFPPRPELADDGMIAFTRPNGVWVVGADGSEARLIYPLDQTTSWVESLRWSPDGRMLALSRSVPDPGNMAITLIDTSGTVVEEYAGFQDPQWSPDGLKLAAVRNRAPGGLSGWIGEPVIIDRASKQETVLTPSNFSSTSPTWSPDGSQVAFICISGLNYQYLPDGTYQEWHVDCGGDGVRVASAIGGASSLLFPGSVDTWGWFGALSWSPDGSTIALLSSGGPSCNGYLLIRVPSASVERCLSLPDYGSFGGRCGGPSESGASDWSPDSTTLAYHWQFREGENGVALMNLATNQRRMILATDATSVSFSGDGTHLAFGGSGHVWLARTDGGDAVLLTEGSSPAWQPLR
jgi:Tol biopolymer transport system component